MFSRPDDAARGLSRRLLAVPWTIRLAVTAWAVVGLVLGLRVCLAPRENSCYPIFQGAGSHWRAGLELYRFPKNGCDFYRYSPLVAAVFSPVSLLPERVGSLLWRLVNAGAYLAALGWWARAVLSVRGPTGQRRPLTTAEVALLSLLVLPFTVGNLNNGQSNPLVLGLLLAGTVAVARRYWNLASGCAAAACLLKLYPLAFGLLLAVVYPRRFLGRFVLALGLGLALPFLLQRPGYVVEQYGDWLTALRQDNRQILHLHLAYRDLCLLCRVWLTPLSLPAYRAVELAVAAGLAGVCWFRWPRTCEPDAGAGPSECDALGQLLGLACCWMTAFGPAAESSTYILVAPSLAWAVLRSRHEGTRIVRGVLRGAYVLLLSAHVSVWFPGGVHWRDCGPQPLAALLLFAVLLSEALTRRAEERPAVGKVRRAA